MTVQPCPRCGARHRTGRALVTCAYDRYAYESGEGPWAFVHKFTASYFRTPRYHVRLFATEQEARAAATAVKVPCSGTCSSHSVRNLAKR